MQMALCLQQITATQLDIEGIMGLDSLAYKGKGRKQSEASRKEYERNYNRKQNFSVSLSLSSKIS